MVSALVLNTTETKACSSSKNEVHGQSPFNRETSSPNVVFSELGSLMFEFNQNHWLTNDVSFDIGIVFTPQEVIG